MSGARDSSHLPVGVVLAGGRARRMGGEKAIAQLGGRPLVAYPVEAMRSAGLDPLVVAKPDSELPDLGCPVLLEPAQPYHPLCGILAALRHCEGRAVVVCGCDMPFLAPALLAWLGELDVPLAVVSVGGRVHPLLGRYTPGLLDALAERLRMQSSLTETVIELGAQILGEPELTRFGEPERICLNVNTRAELAQAECLLESDPAPPRSADLASELD